MPAEPSSRVLAAAHTARYLQGLEFSAGADQHGRHRLAIAARINAHKDLIGATRCTIDRGARRARIWKAEQFANGRAGMAGAQRSREIRPARPVT